MPRLDSPVPRPLALSQREGRGYEQFAESIAQHNTQAFANYLDHPIDPIDKRSWKFFKNREKIDVYRSRASRHTDIFASAAGAPRVPLVKLLCVGTLNGSVNDAMLGCATPTAISMAARSNYVYDEFVQHQALCTIKSPTLNEPFEYVGLKWALRSSPLASLMNPRDFVFVEVTGFRFLLRRDGSYERIGYVVYHSVDRADVPPLTDVGVTRAKLSLCVFFRQASPDVVQVFGTITTDPGGQLHAKPAADSAARTLLAISRAMDCALKRKLVWLLRQHGTQASETASGHPIKSAKHKWWCGQCARELAGRRARVACRICRTPVCSRCVKTDKLAIGASMTDLALVPLPVCTGCLAAANRLENPGQVALDIALGPQVKQTSRAGTCDQEKSARSPLRSCMGSSIPDRCHRSASDTIETVADDCGSTRHRFANHSHSSTAESWTSSSYSTSSFDLDLERQRMLRMMNSLCLQAEETYSATMSLSSRGRFVDALDD